MPDELVYRSRSVTEGWGGAPGLTTFYFRQDLGAIPEAQLAVDDILTHVRSAWTDLMPVFPTQWIVQVDPVVDVINTDNGDLSATYSGDGGAPISGASTTGFGPQAAMICATLLTPGIVDSRRVRGRCFLGPVASVMDVDGTPQADTVALCDTALSTLYQGTSSHPTGVVWSRRRGISVAHPTGLGGSAHDITAVSIRNSFAMLTSRRQ